MAVAGNWMRRGPVAETFTAGCGDLEHMTSKPEVDHLRPPRTGIMPGWPTIHPEPAPRELRFVTQTLF